MITLWNGNSSLTPWRTLVNLQKDLDRIFAAQDDTYSDQPILHPACDVDETETHFMVNLDLPGISKKDINIEVRENQLVISAERKNERKTRGSSERYYGKFHRMFNLPAGIEADKIEAQYEDGVLTVALQKPEVAKARQIKISDGKSSFFGRLVGKSETTEKEEKKVSAINVA